MVISYQKRVRCVRYRRVHEVAFRFTVVIFSRRKMRNTNMYDM